MQQPEHSIENFLKPTEFCDYTHPDIQTIVRKFKQGSDNQKELALKIFYFVRDSIHYSVGNWNKKASHTLKQKHGTCTNSANLFVALARACKIPAGYGVLDVVGPEYFGPIILPHFSKVISKKSKHVYVHVFLEEKWIKVDPSDDEPLSINTEHLNPQSRLVDWNGINDAVLNLNPTHIIKDSGPLTSIDHILKKKQRKYLYIPVYLANLYIQFLRTNGKTITKHSDLYPSFIVWLRKNRFFSYFLAIFFFTFVSGRIRWQQKFYNVLSVR